MNWKTMAEAVLAVLVCSVWAVAQPRIPVDQDAIKQAETAVRDAQQDGNSGAIMRAYRRWLEFYPNEPELQAKIYRAMALISEQNGEADQAKLWNTAARSLDPTPDDRVQASGSTTRGKLDQLPALLAAASQAAQTIQAVRQSFKAANPGPVPAQAQFAFPQQPVGSPGYQPRPVTQPMPGYVQQPQYVAQPGQMQPIAFDAQGNPIPQTAPQPLAFDAQGNPIPPTAPQPAMQPIAFDAQGNPIPPTAPQPAMQPIAFDAQGNPIPPTAPQPATQPIAFDAQGNPIPQSSAQQQIQSQALPFQAPPPVQLGQQMAPLQAQQAQQMPSPQRPVQPPMAVQYPQSQQQPVQLQAPPAQPAQVPGQPIQQQMTPIQAQQAQQMPGQQMPAQPQMAAQYPQPQQQQVQPQSPPAQPAQFQGRPIQQQMSPRHPQQYAPQRAPYGAPPNYARPQQARRGDAALPIKVFHDHSRLGDSSYFEPACGALLLVENGSLTFTPTGGEAPLLIPESEILEIRLNTALGKESGAFHVITQKGLYLQFMPEGATADEGRADVDELRRQLRLEQ